MIPSQLHIKLLAKLIFILFSCIYKTGNILVIITIFRFMSRESITNIFIANLNAGDILVIGFALPFRVSIWPLLWLFFSNSSAICVVDKQFLFDFLFWEVKDSTAVEHQKNT